jgi:hypothetical protein
LALRGVGAGEGDEHRLLLAVQLGGGAAAGFLREGDLQSLGGEALAEAFDGGPPGPGRLGDLDVGRALVGQKENLESAALPAGQGVVF